MNASSQSNSLASIESYLSHWHSRAVLHQTNWLYRVDALRPNDITYLNTLQDKIILLRDYASPFLIMATVLSHLIQNGRTPHIRERLPFFPSLGLSQVLLSERYCFLMDYFQGPVSYFNVKL